MLLINLQSFVMRNEIDMSYLAPLITVIIFIFFYSAIVKLPLMWSALCTILGYTLYALIQVFYVYTLFGSIESAQSSIADGYILQTITATTGILGSWILYKLGLGFAFDFDKLRFKSEHVLLISLIIIVLFLMAILFYFNQMWLLLIFFGITFVILLYYSIRTEELDINDNG